jgi:hypothetical protein
MSMRKVVIGDVSVGIAQLAVPVWPGCHSPGKCALAGVRWHIPGHGSCSDSVGDSAELVQKSPVTLGNFVVDVLAFRRTGREAGPYGTPRGGIRNICSALDCRYEGIGRILDV